MTSTDDESPNEAEDTPLRVPEVTSQEVRDDFSSCSWVPLTNSII